MTLSTIEPSALESQMRYADALAQSNLLPRSYQRQPANVLLAIQMGSALGIPAIQAINSIHVIEGKPSASADLIASMVRRAGHKLRIRMGSDKDGPTATATLIRADDPEFEFEAVWTMAKARQAGLAGRGVWRSYPDQMLRARAITDVARQGAGDALFGVVYTPEELGADEHPERVEQVSAPEQPADERMISPRQRTALWTVAQVKGIGKDDFRVFINEETGREVASTNDLTRAEFDGLMQKLNSLEDVPKPDPKKDDELVDAELVESTN